MNLSILTYTYIELTVVAEQLEGLIFLGIINYNYKCSPSKVKRRDESNRCKAPWLGISTFS